MRLFRWSTKNCTLIFFVAMLCICGLIAWNIGTVYAKEIVWVAREKITDAEPVLPLEQTNVIRGFLFGIPVFVAGFGASAVLAELYCAALSFFRGESPNT